MHNRVSKTWLLGSFVFLVAFLACSLSSRAADATPATAKPDAKSARPERQKKQEKQTQHRATARTAGRKAHSAGKQSNAVFAGQNSSTDEVAALKEQLAAQQKQIEQLRNSMEQQKQLLERAMAAQPSQAASTQAANLGQVASLAPIVPAPPRAAGASGPALRSLPEPGKAPVTQEQVEGYTEKVNGLEKTVQTLNNGVAGFKFSGDLRLRSDNIFRSSNSVSPDQQNVRARYRLRLNVDKAVTDQIDFHLTLGSGTFNNPLTQDSDFSGLTSRGPIFITEASGAYHPNRYFDVRGGKMQEVFADNSQFLLDDDVRFNGFQQAIKAPIATSSLGAVNFEFRAGQYLLTNPNVQVLPSTKACTPPPAQVITSLPATIITPPTLPANCAYLTAGFTPGRKVPTTDLFDQGALLSVSNERWTHTFTANIQLWRNPNAIQLGSVAAGFPLVVNPYYGVSLPGPITTGLGSATTTKGGAIYTASHYQVGRVAYRVDHKELKSSRQNFPIYFEVQGARNFGSSFYNNAFVGTVNIGETKKFGDVLLKYAFFYKQANSMISQVTDDDVGTGTGVNLRTHVIKVDLGLNKFLVWQNRLYIQNELAGNDPTRHFFVTLPKGTSTQYRYQSQMLFTF